jgi:hypothetical protein
MKQELTPEDQLDCLEIARITLSDYGVSLFICDEMDINIERMLELRDRLEKFLN